MANSPRAGGSSGDIPVRRWERPWWQCQAHGEIRSAGAQARRKRREVVSLVSVPLLCILSAQDRLKPTNTTRTEELGWLNRHEGSQGLDSNSGAETVHVQVDFLVLYAADLLLNWILPLYSLGERGDHSYQVIALSPFKETWRSLQDLVQNYLKLLWTSLISWRKPLPSGCLILFLFWTYLKWKLGRVALSLYKLWLKNVYFSLQSVLFCTLNVALQNKGLGFSPPLFLS